MTNLMGKILKVLFFINLFSSLEHELISINNFK